MTRSSSSSPAFLRRAWMFAGLLALASGGVARAHDRDHDGDDRHAHAEHARPSAATARVLVINDAGGPVTLRVDGRPVGRLESGQARQLSMPPGSHRIHATYHLLGVERSLRASTVRLVHGERRQVRLQPPAESLLAVDNPLDRAVQVRVDGRVRATVGPHARGLISVAAGPTWLELLVDGRVVEAEQRRVDAFAGLRWTPRPALVGDLVVVNPLPIPVALTCERGQVRTIPSHGRTTCTDLQAGELQRTVRRVDGGEPIGTLRTTVVAFASTPVTVPEPSRGVVALFNPRQRAVRVYVDGRVRTTLSGGERERLLLRPGVHEVALVTERTGRVLERRSVRVDRYDVALVEAPTVARRGTVLSLRVGADGARLGLAWDDAAWDEASWDDAAWDDAAWDDASWDDASWDDGGLIASSSSSSSSCPMR